MTVRQAAAVLLLWADCLLSGDVPAVSHAEKEELRRAVRVLTDWLHTLSGVVTPP